MTKIEELDSLKKTVSRSKSKPILVAVAKGRELSGDLETMSEIDLRKEIINDIDKEMAEIELAETMIRGKFVPEAYSAFAKPGSVMVNTGNAEDDITTSDALNQLPEELAERLYAVLDELVKSKATAKPTPVPTPAPATILSSKVVPPIFRPITMATDEVPEDLDDEDDILDGIFGPNSDLDEEDAPPADTMPKEEVLPFIGQTSTATSTGKANKGKKESAENLMKDLNDSASKITRRFGIKW